MPWNTHLCKHYLRGCVHPIHKKTSCNPKTCHTFEKREHNKKYTTGGQNPCKDMEG
jgi:hypothetical protein